MVDLLPTSSEGNTDDELLANSLMDNPSLKDLTRVLQFEIVQLACHSNQDLPYVFEELSDN